MPRVAAAMARLFDLFFEDKRYTTMLLTGWMFLSCILFQYLGAFHIQFMTFGPSDATIFMGMPINTWGRWTFLAMFSFSNTAINVFLSNALGPWMQNTIQDHKCVTLPYKKQVCFFICQMECFYSHIMSIFGIFLFFSQLDFLLIRTAADLIVNGYSTVRFMKHKTVDPDMYLTSSRYANAAGMGECLHDEEAGIPTSKQVGERVDGRKDSLGSISSSSEGSMGKYVGPRDVKP